MAGGPSSTTSYVSARTLQQKEEYDKGRHTQDAADRMKPAPAPQEKARFFRSQVEFLALQAFIGGQNYDKCKRDDEQEKESADKPSRTPVKPPRYESRKRADRSEGRLHQGASLVAGPPLRYR